ncbi:MAG TPA: methyltransferase domain-containing protein [bacterium]|nr:methyltransferase domain-containing protein [bacterium]
MAETHRDYFNRLAMDWEARMPGRPDFRDYLKEFNVGKGERILDIGAGTGRMTRFLGEFSGRDGCVVAQDIAERMLSESRKISGNGSIHHCCEDVMNLAYRERSFDKILCFCAFPHFQDKPRALSEMARVLKPGGRLLILHTDSSERLNAFHATLAAPVNRDRLPGIVRIRELFGRTGLVPVRMEESDSLYWAEGEKP